MRCSRITDDQKYSLCNHRLKAYLTLEYHHSSCIEVFVKNNYYCRIS